MSVRINGSNLATFGRVFFGGNEAVCSTAASNASCTVPAGSGTVDVSIRNPDGQRAVLPGAFTYIDPCPEVWINSTSGNVGTTGAPVTLSAVASSELPLTYQWMTGGAPIPGETHASITVQPHSSTTYALRASNSCGASDAFMTVTVCGSTPARIVVQPDDAAAAAGNVVSLCLDYSAVTPATTIQWYEGAANDTSHPVPDSNLRCLGVKVTKSTAYWARLTNVCGSVDSRVAAVTLVGAPLRHRAARP